MSENLNRLPEEEFNNRISKVRKLMQGRFQALLIFSSSAGLVRYFSDFPTDAICYGLYVLPLEGDPTLIMRFTTHQHFQSWVKDIRQCINLTGLVHESKKLLQEKNIDGALGYACDEGGMGPADVAIVPYLKQISDNVQNAMDIIEAVRAIKSPTEIEQVKKAAEISKYGLETLVDSLKKRKSAYETLADYEYALRSRGVERWNNEIGMPNFNWDLNNIRAGKPGSMATMWNVEYRGLWYQFHRNIDFERTSVEQQKLRDLTLDSYEKAAKAIAPGATVDQIVEAMAEPFREAGKWPDGSIPFSFDANTYSGINSLGHGMGYNFGEPPGVKSGVRTELKPGMLLCIHPNYFAGFDLKYTVGDTFLLTENGSEELGEAIPLTPGL